MLIPQRGCSEKNWLGVCGPPSKSLTLFMAKICDFQYPIYDLADPKLVPCFRPVLYLIH